MIEKIVFYGKGGVGKSTLIANISAALIDAGFRVLQVGCDAKADSSRTLNGGFSVPTVSQAYSAHGTLDYDRVVHRGFKGVFCIEAGVKITTEAADGRRSVVQPLDLLIESGLIDKLPVDFVLFDVSGDESCAELHQTFYRAGITRAYIVTTADFASLTTVNSIVEALERFGDANIPVPFAGLIANGISSSFEDSFIADFAKQIGTRTIGKIPRSLMVRQCELYGKTVVEASPLSNQAFFYRRLANQIVDETNPDLPKTQPHSLSREKMRIWALAWADRLFSLENGLVTDGAAI